MIHTCKKYYHTLSYLLFIYFINTYSVLALASLNCMFCMFYDLSFMTLSSSAVYSFTCLDRGFVGGVQIVVQGK